jgi:hypothetical protein
VTTFAQRYAEDRRLVLLQALHRAPGYQAGEFVLQQEAARFGHSVSRDLLRTDLAWLAEQGLVEITEGETQVALLTPRGQDAAMGLAHAPGVKRPAPGTAS